MITLELASKTIRVMIVDDHPALREGLGHRISAQPDMTVCGEAVNVAGAMAKVKQAAPDVVVVDLALRDGDGLSLVKTLKSQSMNVRMVVHSMYHESLYAKRCIHAGAMGYVNKEADPQAVIDAIREVVSGRVYLSEAMTSQLLCTLNGAAPQADIVDLLSDRQLEVFRLIGDGCSTIEIATRLHISKHTVESHREHIKEKLNTQSFAELTRLAILWGREQYR